MVEGLTTFIISHIETLPLGLFVFVVSFLEEVVAPIPSLIVMTTVGSFAAAQGKMLYAIPMLALVGTFGKILGALILYVFSDKMEDMVMPKVSHVLGITHEQIEAFGKRLRGRPRDYVLLTAIRALPAIPSSFISIGCGVFKVPLPLFITATLLGTVLRNTVYLYVGYVGATAIASMLAHGETIESVVELLVAGGLVAGIAYVYWRRRKTSKSYSRY